MLETLIADQARVVTRAQALASGMSLETLRAHLLSGRWQRVLPGCYATFTGPVPRASHLAAVVLHAGTGAVLSHHTAAELLGLRDEPVQAVHVTVPSTRQVRAVPGVVVHRSCRTRTSTHPAQWPPRTRIEQTVVDLTQSADTLRQAIGWLTRACARRLTTPERLRAAFAEHKKLRWRRQITAVLADVQDGCHSVLEVVYLADVERAHGLPAGRRQTLVKRGDGNTYDDVRYEGFNLVVELDGRLAHPDETRARDRRRDNATVEQGVRVVRYGWVEVVGAPCEVAAQIVRLLRSAGWQIAARRCRREGCMITVT